MTLKIQYLAAGGFAFMSMFGSFFWPAVVSLFQTSYFAVRILTDIFAFTNGGFRKVESFWDLFRFFQFSAIIVAIAIN